MSDAPEILLTGATGYVGGRLLGELARRGRAVRCITRRPEALEGRIPEGVEIVGGDLLEPESLRRAMHGTRKAIYLVHSMGSKRFEERDREAARNFAAASREAGLERIVYLGGLGDEEEGLSAHLRSRHEVGRILREAGAPTVELRASIIIGSGSLSFELVRALVERLPVMVTPRWVRVPAQPIAIDDLLEILIAAIDLELREGKGAVPMGGVFEIGGADVVSYAEIMEEYARQRGLRRLSIPVPLLTTGLSSLWLGLVTPIYARVGAKLIDSVRHPTVAHDDASESVFGVRTVGVKEAIARALRNEDRELAQTRWSDALSAGGEPHDWGGVRFGSRLVDSRRREVGVPPAKAFRPIQRIGGETGWHHADVLWRIRGFLDLLAGGVGMRRGRRSPEDLAVGDALDFWRVEAYEPDRLLRLRAEMKVPGRAWLEFEVRPIDGGGSEIRQTALFDPVGLFGLAYWHALWPLHQLVFAGMLRSIAQRAEAEEA